MIRSSRASDKVVEHGCAWHKLSRRSLSRRELLTLLASVSAWSPAARGQQSKLALIGYLGSETADAYASRLDAFRAGLAEAGFVENRNVAISFRWAEGRYERLPALAKELASQPVSVIVAPGGAPVALAAKAATSIVPIVFELGGDPVALGLVPSLSRPGANLTGISSLSVEVSPKRLEYLRECLPSAGTITVVVNPSSPTAASQLSAIQAAAPRLGVHIRTIEINSEADLASVLTTHAQAGTGGVLFTSDPYFAFRSRMLGALALRHAVPAITQSRDFTAAGGLMSYGGDFAQSHRYTGIYAGRILNGEQPSELPVQQVTKLELFLNMTAAERLKIKFSPALFSIADAIID